MRAYLRAFGPAPWRDIAAWAGISVSETRAGGADLELVRYRDEAGRELLDLPGAPLPDPDTPAPVRFLPHWDASLLVHARRTGLLPEAHRSRVFSDRNPFSVGAYLVDGRVAGAWSLREGRVVLDPFEAVTARQRHAIEAERAALEAFHALRPAPRAAACHGDRQPSEERPSGPDVARRRRSSRSTSRSASVAM